MPTWTHTDLHSPTQHQSMTNPLCYNNIQYLVQFFLFAFYIYIYIYNRPIGIMVIVFTNGPGDQVDSYQRMVLDDSLLKTPHYKVWIKSKE